MFALLLVRVTNKLPTAAVGSVMVENAMRFWPTEAGVTVMAPVVPARLVSEKEPVDETPATDAVT